MPSILAGGITTLLVLNVIAFGFVTLVIVLAKMHGDIIVLKEKVKSLFDLWNSRGK